jgi:cysteine synthase
MYTNQKSQIYENVLQLIGRTPLVRLNQINNTGAAQVLAKLEFYNPTGSVKDRIALAMIETAEKEGHIKPGDTIVEPTSGNTGTSLSMVCALKGYRMVAVMPEEMSQERKDMMTAFGAKLVLVPNQGKSEAGLFAKEDIEATMEIALELASKPGYFMPNQFANPANTQVHMETTALELWEDSGGQVDAFVAGVGTSGTAMGCGRKLKEFNPEIKLYVVEPANSAVIKGESPGHHRIQGIGEGFIPDLFEHEHHDEAIKVSDIEAKATSCRLARMEGIFAGYSAGANVFAALQVVKYLEPEKTVATIIPDTGMKYLSTELFRRSSDICTIHCCTLKDPEARKDCQKGGPGCCVLEPC